MPQMILMKWIYLRHGSLVNYCGMDVYHISMRTSNMYYLNRITSSKREDDAYIRNK